MERTQVTISVGPELFRFECFQDWVHTARLRLHRCRQSCDTTICVDKRGRVAQMSCDFVRALNDDAFPVIVYALEPPAKQEPHA